MSFAAVGCGGSVPTNQPGNANSASVSPVAVNIDPANMPDGLSARPVEQPANTIGVNAASVRTNGATPTPGIPGPAEIKKGTKLGATPTPGIPSADEMRKMLSKPPTNVNGQAAPMKGSDVPMMKSNRPVMMKSNKPTGGKPPTEKPTP
ncbi:MAG: hypothetical protein WAU71_05540 [Pyrinomonadaceae bacterium]